MGWPISTSPDLCGIISSEDRLLPCGWPALVFPASLGGLSQTILSCQESPLARTPVETPLPRLQFSWEALWEEVSSLLIKGAMGSVKMLQDWGAGGGGVRVLLPCFPGHQMHW